MSHPLDPIRLRLSRAEEHLNTLSARSVSLSEGDAYTFAGELDPTSHLLSVKLKEAADVPLELGLILGDFVHNTRSALDHLVYQLVLLAGGAPHERHQFPILDSEADWQSKITKNPRGMLEFVNPSLVAVIESLQPYMPGSGLPSLTVLRNFSNTDKHRLVHVGLVSLTTSPKISVDIVLPGKVTEVELRPPGDRIGPDMELAKVHVDVLFPTAGGSIRLPDDKKVNVRADLSVSVLFGPPGEEAVTGQDLRNLLGDVRATVERFSADFSVSPSA